MLLHNPLKNGLLLSYPLSSIIFCVVVVCLCVILSWIKNIHVTYVSCLYCIWKNLSCPELLNVYVFKYSYILQVKQMLIAFCVFVLDPTLITHTQFSKKLNHYTISNNKSLCVMFNQNGNFSAQTLSICLFCPSLFFCRNCELLEHLILYYKYRVPSCHVTSPQQSLIMIAWNLYL